MEIYNIQGADVRLNMELQKDRLIELIESEFGLLDRLLICDAMTRVKIAEVKSGTTVFKKNELLLNYTFSDNKYQDLMNALADSGQHHVVNWVKGNGVYREEFGLDWPLTKTEERTLDCNHEALVDLLDVEEIIPMLFSMGVFNRRQRDSIGSKPTEHERSDALLDAVRRFSLRSYFTFIQCLRQSNQSCVANILENGGVIVPVRASVKCEDLDEIETEIINEMKNMGNASMEEAEMKTKSMKTKDKDSENRWKVTFDRHHDFIVDRLSPDFGVIHKLYSKFAITEDDKYEISAEKNVQKKIRTLIKCMGGKLELGKLIEVLQESDQKHLVNYLESDGNYSEEFGGEWPLTEKQILAIRSNYESLIDRIEMSDLLGRLYMTRVISKRQMEFISSKTTSYEKNEALLEIVRRGSLRSYHQTIDCLKQSNQSPVAEILKKGRVVDENSEMEKMDLGRLEEEILLQINNLLRNRPQSTRILDKLMELRHIAAMKGD